MTDQQVPNNQRILKGIVIILGILIMIALGVIIVTVISRIGDRAEKREASQQAVVQTLPHPGGRSALPLAAAFPERITVVLEKGEEIAESALAPQGLLLRVVKDGATSHLLVIGADGTVRTRIQIRREGSGHDAPDGDE